MRLEKLAIDEDKWPNFWKTSSATLLKNLDGGRWDSTGIARRKVPINEVKTWVTQGWEYVNSLPNNEAIIRLPTDGSV